MTTPSYTIEPLNLNLKPFWQLSPKKFWSGHGMCIRMDLREWRTVEPDLPLGIAVARYLNGLPTDLPPDIILKITALFIEEWEKQAAPIAVEELAS